MAENLANDFATLLAAAVAADSASLQLVSADGAPSAPFRIRIADELILVGARSGTTCSSLTRGVEGTVAASHPAGAYVEQVLTAAGLPLSLFPVAYANLHLAGAVQISDLAFDPATQAEQDALTLNGCSDSYVFTIPDPSQYGNGGALVANQVYGNRARITKTGTISELQLLIGGLSSGNVDVAICTYDGTTYTRVWSKGSTPCPPASAWTNLGNPAVAVTRGAVVFLLAAFDNATATPVASSVRSNTAFSLGPSNLTGRRFSWTKAASFPIPATITDASVANGDRQIAMAVRIT